MDRFVSVLMSRDDDAAVSEYGASLFSDSDKLRLLARIREADLVLILQGSQPTRYLDDLWAHHSGPAAAAAPAMAPSSAASAAAAAGGRQPQPQQQQWEQPSLEQWRTADSFAQSDSFVGAASSTGGAPSEGPAGVAALGSAASLHSAGSGDTHEPFGWAAANAAAAGSGSQAPQQSSAAMRDVLERKRQQARQQQLTGPPSAAAVQQHLGMLPAGPLPAHAAGPHSTHPQHGLGLGSAEADAAAIAKLGGRDTARELIEQLVAADEAIKAHLIHIASTAANRGEAFLNIGRFLEAVLAGEVQCAPQAFKGVEARAAGQAGAG
jgi:hypothetical protein